MRRLQTGATLSLECRRLLAWALRVVGISFALSPMPSKQVCECVSGCIRRNHESFVQPGNLGLLCVVTAGWRAVGAAMRRMLAGIQWGPPENGRNGASDAAPVSSAQHEVHFSMGV